MPELRWGRHSVRLKTRMWIGSENTCAIRIEDKYVAPRHGFILAAGDGWYFLDYRTGGKSAVNGRRCDLPVRLLDGDALRLGKTQLTFHFDDEEQAAAKARRLKQPGEDPSLALQAAYDVQVALRTIYEPNRERVSAFVAALSAQLGDARIELHLAGGTIAAGGAYPDLALPPPDWTLSHGMVARSIDLDEEDGAPALAVIEVPLARRGGRGMLRALRPTSFSNLELLVLMLGGFGLQARLGNRPL